MRYILLITFIVIPNLICSQSNIIFNLDHGYWEHTKLFGTHFGIGYGKKMRKIKASAIFRIGYGERDQFNNNSLIDPDVPSFLEVSSSSNTTLSDSEKLHTRFSTVTDYSREISLNINFDYNFYSKQELDLYIGTGLFVNDVFQFQVLDFRQGYEIDISVYEGPVNIFTVSNQRFLTAGILGRVGCSINKGKNFFSIHLDGGLGPKKTSYFSLGFSAGGLLLAKKEN